MIKRYICILKMDIEMPVAVEDIDNEFCSLAMII